MKINSEICKQCLNPTCTGKDLYKLGYKMIKCKYNGKYMVKKLSTNYQHPED